VQEALAKEEQMRFRIGLHVGDVIGRATICLATGST
jgi:class 3 adenylate cyclase